MRYSVILNGVESAFALKKNLEEMGHKLLYSNMDERQGLKASSKFVFDIGIQDHRKVAEIISKSGMPVAVADSLREEVTTADEF